MPKAILANGTATQQVSRQTDTPKKVKPPHAPQLAALYCRVSTSGQEEDGTSLDTQEERCRHYATEQGYLIDEAHVYREVYTGTELWQRPKLTALREAIRKGCVTHLMAYAIDRLSRDPVHLGVVLSEAEHHRVAVEFVSEPLHPSPEGQLIRFVRGDAARIEVEKIRARALRGKRARVQNGKIHNFGTELYGYRRDKERGVREIYEPEAAMVRSLFRWYAEEKLSVRSIVKRLNGQEVPPPAGLGPPGLRYLLCALGDDAPCMPSAAAVRDAVTHHRSPPDPSLEAAVCGWPSSHTHVLRQEETTDGHQQALGRHLGYLAGAE